MTNQWRLQLPVAGWWPKQTTELAMECPLLGGPCLGHVDDNELTAFIAGHMPDAEQSLVRAHLDTCAECRMIVVGAVRQHQVSDATPSRDTTVLALGSTRTTARVDRRVFTPGESVGPYVIERLIGAGGMGVVYAARDSRLDRTVALKLIRRDDAVAGSEQLAERLRRESKALARLSHPSVTTVYELGSSGGEVYVAMEYVAGTTLRAWLAERRDANAILATFLDAGRGLAAAHAAGLVHRDFKPDNVLLGTDGTVKVTDFGLATIVDNIAADRAGTSGSPEPALELTRTGVIAGTPAYMAPEQFRGATVDARTDQFAFCVSLYEALVGRRPWRSSSADELAREVLAGHVEIPRTARVSARVRGALVRGLATDPEKRFASMADLIAMLAPRRRTALVAIAGSSVVTAALVMVSVLARADAPPTCQGASEAVATIWSPTRRAAIERAFVASRAPDAAVTWRAVERRLDGYLDAWTTMHVASCKATRVHAQQSEAALDLRTACLERQRGQVDALLRVFERADVEVVTRARDAVATLPDLALCADVDGLARRTPVPADAEVRRQHEVLRAKIDQARAQIEVARYAHALPLLDEVVADSVIERLPALDAEAHHLRAKIFSARGDRTDAEPALHHALVRAQASRADDLVAIIAVDLAFAISPSRARYVEAMRWADFAAAAIAAKGGDDLLAARLDTVRASIFMRRGDIGEAEAANRRALETATRKAPGSALEAEVHDALGIVLSLQGKLEDAVAMFQKAVAQTEQIYGATHSLTAAVRMNLANALGATRRYDESRAQYEAALAIREALFGKDNVQVALVLSNLGQVLQESGKLDEAQVALERALAIRISQLGPDAVPVAKTTANLGYLLLARQRFAPALAQFTRAIQITERHLEPDDPMRADALAGSGTALIGLGRSHDAIAPLERAISLVEKGNWDPVEIASMKAALGQALYDVGRERTRAIRLGRAARAILADAGLEDVVSEIDAWLPRKAR